LAVIWRDIWTWCIPASPYLSGAPVHCGWIILDWTFRLLFTGKTLLTVSVGGTSLSLMLSFLYVEIQRFLQTCPLPTLPCVCLIERTLSKFADDTELGGMGMHRKAVLPFSETWTGWRVGRRGT